MIVIINDIPTKVEPRTTIDDVAQMNNINTSGVAIALNGKIVNRNNWSITELTEGDNIIIIKAAYGG